MNSNYNLLKYIFQCRFDSFESSIEVVEIYLSNGKQHYSRFNSSLLHSLLIEITSTFIIFQLQ